MTLYPPHEPLLITLEAYKELAQLPVNDKASWPAAPEPASAPAASELAPSGLVTVPIHGPMTRHVSPRLKSVLDYFDVKVCDMGATAAQLTELKSSPDVKAVLLDIDSPGGSVNGTPELAAAVKELAASKHVYAYTSGLACSAAYWVASQCDGIYAAPSARVGSIGVLLPLLDCSERYAKAGLRVELITAGKFKATGFEGTSITDEQKELLQQQADDTWALFKQAVTTRREIAPEHMEGQTFTGAKGMENGLVDACANSLAAVQAKLEKRHQF